MQTVEELNRDFGLPDVMVFDEPYAGMPRALITTPACRAEIFLQGAHLTRWEPAPVAPVLFVSERSAFAAGKAIRGGIPVVFPWFGSPETSPVHAPAGSASHGFARTSPWTLRFAALAGEEVHLSLTLDHNDVFAALGFAGFQLAYDAVLGEELTVRLSVANTGSAPFAFEEALHAYFTVGDSQRVSVSGLKGTEYLDKTEKFRRKTQMEDLLRFSGEVDRPYLNTTAPLTLKDPALRRDLRLTKAGSRTTVTWNPGPALAVKLPDLAPDAWQQFVCLETANAAENMITLQPREAHTMEMHVSVERG